VAQNETRQQGAHEDHGIKRYILVWGALLAFTLITVLTGRINLGWANIWLAMLIAVTKATLVVLFFMHLWDEGGVNRLVFVVSLLFLGVLILGTFGDIATRLKITLPNEGPLAPMHQTRHGHGGDSPAPAPAPH
jgi:cytochrome c oxidase subunit 4